MYAPSGGIGPERPTQILVELKRFHRGLASKNILFSTYSSLGTTSIVHAIKWDEKEVEIRSQSEGCFHCHPVLGPYKLSWEELQKAYEENADLWHKEVYISKNNLDKLLKLKDLNCSNEDDKKTIDDILIQDNTIKQKKNDDEKTDLTVFFDSMDLGFEPTGDWKKDEKKLHEDYEKNLYEE